MGKAHCCGGPSLSRDKVSAVSHMYKQHVHALSISCMSTLHYTQNILQYGTVQGITSDLHISDCSIMISLHPISISSAHRAWSLCSGVALRSARLFPESKNISSGQATQWFDFSIEPKSQQWCEKNRVKPFHQCKGTWSSPPCRNNYHPCPSNKVHRILHYTRSLVSR